MMTTNNILLCIAIVYVLYRQYPEKFEAVKLFIEGGFEGSETFLVICVILCYLYFNSEYVLVD